MTTIRPYIDAGDVPGAIVGVLRDGRMSLGAAGTTAPGGGTAMRVDMPVRISSNTKPLMAALTLSLIADGVLALEDPIERFVPELADRRVLRRLDGPLDDTVPAQRLITVEDLLTMRLGFGFVFEADCPAVAAAAEAGLGIGPPDPSAPLTPEGWMARFAQLPLLEQPGSHWRYDLAYAVLGVVLSRADRRPLEVSLRSRILDPLGMIDTSFVAAPGRLPPCFTAGEAGLVEFDGTTGSRWSTPPSFPDARNGLVSTAADLLRFAGALLDGGAGVLTKDAVSAMTRDRLTAEQRRGSSAQMFLDGFGWGYGVQVVTRQHDPSVRLPRYGWGGGLGTLWYSWPDERTAAVLLTQVLPPPATMITAFVEHVDAILDGSE